MGQSAAPFFNSLHKNTFLLRTTHGENRVKNEKGNRTDSKMCSQFEVVFSRFCCVNSKLSVYVKSFEETFLYIVSRVFKSSIFCCAHQSRLSDVTEWASDIAPNMNLI
jgi:hypothetical protein